MVLDSYSALQTSIGNWLNRADLTSVIPDFITLAHAEIVRRLIAQGPPRDMMGRSDATLDSEFIAVPTDFEGVRAWYLAGSTNPLEQVEPEKITERKALYPNQSGDPQVYALVGSEFQFWPAPSGEYTAELTYWKRPSPLSDSVSSNWVLDKHPDAYLFGSLAASAPFLQDDVRLTTWAALFTASINSIVASGKATKEAPHLAMPIRTNII